MTTHSCVERFIPRLLNLKCVNPMNRYIRLVAHLDVEDALPSKRVVVEHQKPAVIWMGTVGAQWSLRMARLPHKNSPWYSRKNSGGTLANCLSPLIMADSFSDSSTSHRIGKTT